MFTWLGSKFASILSTYVLGRRVLADGGDDADRLVGDDPVGR